ncbi:hypothetical protein MAR_020463 [Mya arenaria]|uniref:Uncharacterized protein n=1 Tax=Mya arenaria TaxID=6604 RepID=A0ABY7E7F8_MYAAR|nr:hypothetical protein MAR_020463 [Mya arenaria]
MAEQHCDQVSKKVFLGITSSLHARFGVFAMEEHIKGSFLLEYVVKRLTEEKVQRREIKHAEIKTFYYSNNRQKLLKNPPLERLCCASDARFDRDGVCTETTLVESEETTPLLRLGCAPDARFDRDGICTGKNDLEIHLKKYI